MKLKFFNPQQLEKNLKASIHKTGKLGFTIEAAKKMKLETAKSIGIATNEEDENDKNLYVVVYEDNVINGFKVSKAGNYHYINTKALFDNIKLDYTNNTISFDIYEENIDGSKVFKFKMREKGKNSLEIPENQ